MIADIASDLKADSAMTLSKASAGCQLRIRQLEGGECQRLREIGFCEELEISKLSDGRNMICSVCGTRLALSKKLGDQVLVEEIHEAEMV
jgi:ferrous iron transport protein A